MALFNFGKKKRDFPRQVRRTPEQDQELNAFFSDLSQQPPPESDASLAALGEALTAPPPVRTGIEVVAPGEVPPEEAAPPAVTTPPAATEPPAQQAPSHREQVRKRSHSGKTEHVAERLTTSLTLMQSAILAVKSDTRDAILAEEAKHYAIAIESVRKHVAVGEKQAEALDKLAATLKTIAPETPEKNLVAIYKQARSAHDYLQKLCESREKEPPARQ